MRDTRYEVLVRLIVGVKKKKKDRGEGGGDMIAMPCT